MKEKILVIGAGILDVLVHPVNKDVFQKGSVAVDTIRVSTGGDALNEATVLARLKGGKNVYLNTVLGKDEAGASVLSHCAEEGICTEYIVSDEHMETGVNIVMVQEDGSRSFFTNPKSTLRRLSPEHLPDVFPKDAGVLCLASIFVSPELGNRELAGIFRRAADQGMTVCADMTKCKNKETAEDMREAFSLLDYLFANEEEAKLVTGEKEVSAAADVLMQCGVKNVIIKCGADGCYVKNNDLEQQFPAVPPDRCVDTTGAGDSFAAGFLCALSEGRELKECIRWANACGSLAVEKVGACAGVRNREQAEERIRRSAAEPVQKNNIRKN